MDIKEINSYGQEMVEYLRLKTSPVAVKLLSKGGINEKKQEKEADYRTHFIEYTLFVPAGMGRYAGNLPRS